MALVAVLGSQTFSLHHFLKDDAQPAPSTFLAEPTASWGVRYKVRATKTSLVSLVSVVAPQL